MMLVYLWYSGEMAAVMAYDQRDNRRFVILKSHEYCI